MYCLVVSAVPGTLLLLSFVLWQVVLAAYHAPPAKQRQREEEEPEAVEPLIPANQVDIISVVLSV